MAKKSYQLTTDHGHKHTASLDMNGNGRSSNNKKHTHAIKAFKVAENNGHIHRVIRG